MNTSHHANGHRRDPQIQAWAPFTIKRRRNYWQCFRRDLDQRASPSQKKKQACLFNFDNICKLFP